MTSCAEASRAEGFLGEQRRLLERAEGDAFVAGHVAFLRALAALPHRFFEGVDGERAAEHARFFRERHSSYLLHTEAGSGREALLEPNVTLGGLLEATFGAGAERWQRELGRELGRRRCARVVMVGCGPLPVTLLWLAALHPALDCLGLDSNPAALEQGAALAHQLGARSLRFAAVDGAVHDYAGADLVYVANQVTPKRQVLERIRVTVDRPLTVIARDPYHHGWLIADPVLEVLPEGYALERTGGESPVFLSRDLVLSLGVARASHAR